MRIESIQMKQTNSLIKDYLNNDQQINDFIDYPINNLEQRLQDLNNQTFDRKALTDVLHSMNEQWSTPEQTLKNISRLQASDSVVVIGGQQAGLLTGPLYTINKIVSLIQYSRQQEEALGVPVIPVFWIAGEDHDFAEINHVNVLHDTRMKKMPISQFEEKRIPVGDLVIDQQRAKDWLNKLFLTVPETVHTKKLYDELIDCLQDAKTYVDFFAKLIYRLFPTEGLVLINSSDKNLRNIESDYFQAMINQQEGISRTIYQTRMRLKRLGYPIPVEAEKDDTHLFYHLNRERVLLKRQASGHWIGKQDDINFTTNELIEIAKHQPQLLSNNVMTRPIMQEFLFPTLAFIGGNAEISYWMLLRETFHLFDKKMPPLVPRLSYTFIDRKLGKLLTEYNLSVEYVINHGVHQDKMNYLFASQQPAVEQMFRQLNETIKYVHQPVQKAAYQLRADVGQFADRNLFHLQKTVNQLKNRMNQAIEEDYEQTINDFDLLQGWLQPENSLQERMWNVLPLINEYGSSFIHALINEPCSFEENHFVVYL